MNNEFRNFTYNELKAHYKAVEKRLGGLGNSPGLVPLPRVQGPVVTPVAEPQPKPVQIFYVEDLPKNKFNKLLSQVANKYSMHPSELIGPNRKSSIVKIRREFIWQAYYDLGYSQPQIGKWLKKDHTTIVNDLECYAREHNVIRPQIKRLSGKRDNGASESLTERENDASVTTSNGSWENSDGGSNYQYGEGKEPQSDILRSGNLAG